MIYYAKNLLLLTCSMLVLLSTCISQKHNGPTSKHNKIKLTDAERDQEVNTPSFDVVFPMNEYLTTDNSTPYPMVAEDKFQHINTSSFVNVMNYGAAGNGTKADDEAIAKAFAACKDGSGVIFPKGKTFLIQHLNRIPLDKNITVYAYGATIKMAPNTGYNAIAFESTASNGYSNQLLWLGGTFDGNKNQQAWPGSPTGNNDWTVEQSNYGVLTIRGAQFALVKDIALVNTVYDGVDLFECALGVIADSKASSGANLNYSKLQSNNGKGHQSTYFKCTRRNSQAVYFLNLDCTEGSIGVQYSTNFINDSSLAVVSNCRFYNQGQDALHFESCRKVFLYKCTIGCDNSGDYHADVHLSNDTQLAAIENCQFKNGRIDCRNASNLALGLVENCQFESYALNGTDSTTLSEFIHNATHVKNCTFKGRTKDDGVKARYVSESTFDNFNVAVNASTLVNKCTFINGNTAVKSGKGDVAVNDSKFTNTSNPNFSNRTVNAGMLNGAPITDLLSKTVSVHDQNNKLLGYITKKK